MHLCTYVSEERDGEGAGSEALSLLSYTLKGISLADVGIIYMPGGVAITMHLCTYARSGGTGRCGLRRAISAVIHTYRHQSRGKLA